jgi:hypothetical protein
MERELDGPDAPKRDKSITIISLLILRYDDWGSSSGSS